MRALLLAAIALVAVGCEAPEHGRERVARAHKVSGHGVPSHRATGLDAQALAVNLRAEPLVRCRSPRANYDALIIAKTRAVSAFRDVRGAARWLAAIGCVESRYDNAAVSSVGARCVFQFLPGTARDWHVDVRDPESCIQGGARYYHWLRAIWCPRHGRNDRQCRELATASGNWGQGRLIDDQRTSGCLLWDCIAPRAPAETVHHVARVERLIAGGEW